MTRAVVDQIAQAVLYEGYILYPYRPSVKNRQRWTFGGLAPAAHGSARAEPDRSRNQTQCLVRGDGGTRIVATVRFLHITDRRVAQPVCPSAEWSGDSDAQVRFVDELHVDDRTYENWQEAEERVVQLPACEIDRLLEQPQVQRCTIPGRRWTEPIADRDGRCAGVFVRTQRTLELSVALSAAATGVHRVFQITLEVRNRTQLERSDAASHDEAALHSLMSAHAVLHAERGEFVSLTDPPVEYRAVAAACVNVGLWPVLVGEPGRGDAILSAPIILYDYPRVAPESPGNLFDNTEIDELLTLRILTQTAQEKRRMMGVDERSRELLERTERLAGEQLMRLHGAVREWRPVSQSESSFAMMPALGYDERRHLESVRVGGVEIRAGDRVRLRPRGRADILDMALAGKWATVESIERDYEDRVYVAVTVEDDPGRDLGRLGQPGHRFFFGVEEVEPAHSGPAGGAS